MKKLTVLICLLFVALAARPVGQWTEYLSYKSALKVLQVGDKIYCLTTGGLFSYDTSDNSIQKLNVIQGLSDVGVQTIGYSDDADVLIVAYENSNLDLVYSDQVYNMSDIERKQITGDKSIYNILVIGKTAYLSCGFGIVAVNLEKKEIKGTYYIADNAAQIRVNDMCSDGSYLYAATESGIYRADINSDNLQDYGNWELQTSIPNYTDEFDQIEYFNGKVYTNHSGGSSGNDAVYAWNGSSWSKFTSSSYTINDLTASSDKLLVSANGSLSIYNTDGNVYGKVSSYQIGATAVSWITPQSSLITSDGTVWIADSQYALLKASSSGYEQIQPEGPASNRVFSLLTNGTDLWLTDGGRTAAWNNMFYTPRIQLLRNDEWSSFDDTNYDELSGLHDAVCTAVDPNDPDHWYAGLWGGGVFEFQGNDFLARYNNKNSSLQTALPSQPDEAYVRISDMHYDSEGNLWMTNSIVDKPLSVLTTSGEWQSYSLTGITSSNDVGRFTISDDDDLWITIPRNQNTIIVRKADGTTTKKLSAVAYYSNGSDEVYTSLTDIYCIVKDLDGDIWLGTSVGVGVYYDPEDIWSSDTFYASQPGLDENDGLYHALLSSQTVTAIAVDGANQKWFGTKSSGVYLISADGTESLLHFTTDNSPLLSDEITSIAINDKTGEVYIGTSAGLVSYMGTATEGADDYDDVYAYPNPVRENYFGDIVITGLIEDTDIKITDISGNLVFKTTSTGGQAVWDGKNLRGHRVSTGVYLVFGNDKYGEESFVTKILFIH